ncbi:hypothetical protein GCM10027535_44830 [Mycolicibacterium hippocampi]|uniref:Aminoglycoside phosphotransferase n=1 Tax=Mycolicibacterium hippocampi TaxID=659824 RepID=A0A7I9ZK17_9MYCO|nr:hypothetical protein MHIP_17970 [Mycolicibacterium hippocampi]
MGTSAGSMDDQRWFPGGHLGLDVPADTNSLGAGGAEFLTEAFRRAGALTGDNAVVAIEELREFGGGSTGRKAVLSVSYRQDGDLPRDLFVKFSRDFDDPGRDVGRSQMAEEVRFALLTGSPEFPIDVPRCLFADYDERSGTGILITTRIAYGSNGIEPHYDKCADHVMPDPPGHYRALLGALARLAGAHRAGLLGAGFEFPVDMRRLSVGERTPYTADQLHRRVDQLGELASRQPALLPSGVTSPEFLSRLREQVTVCAARVEDLWDSLGADPRYVALCHWNANVDNAWFWRDTAGELRCGLLDWGCVGRMNLAMAIWGSMCSADTDMWNAHFDSLLDHFVAEFAAAGGAPLDVGELRRHLLTYVAITGPAWLLDVPGYLLKRLPNRWPTGSTRASRTANRRAAGC